MSQQDLGLNMRQLTPFLFLSVLFVLTVFFFQNCSSPADESAQITSVANNAPFAFDAQVDTLAHMSCGRQQLGNYDPDAFFSFKAGAYRSGSGLKYTSAFIQATGAFQPPKRLEVLQQSALNGDAKLQISVRTFPGYNFLPGFQAAEGITFGNFNTNLDDSSVGLSLPQSIGTARTRNFASGPLELQDDLTQAGLSSQARNSLNTDQSQLVIGFGNANLPNGLISSGTDPFGRGYRLGFGGVGTTQMVSVQELDLIPRILYNWSCNTVPRILIVHRGDLGAISGCFADPNSNVDPVLSGEQAAQFQVIRSILPFDKWAIDINNNCAVPKTGVAGNCYEPNPPNPTTGPWTPTNIRYGQASCNIAAGTCPHYVSICTRI